MLKEFLQHPGIWKNLTSSAILFLALFILRLIIKQSITRSTTIPTEHRLQWLVKSRTLAYFIFIVGLLVIWASELQTFAVSLMAVAVALVIAFKELIMNISGYFARASAQPFALGDRVEIDGMRGDVVDFNLFFTRILEIGPGHLTNQYTGRAINIPNSLFLNKHIINESFTEHFTLHVFTIPIYVNENVHLIRTILLESAQFICKPYLADAKKTFDKFGQRQGLEPPSVDPRVHVHFYDTNRVELIVRIPAPIAKKGRVEQDIISRFLEQGGKYLTSIEAVAYGATAIEK